MSNMDKDTKNIILGALIGGTIGIGALSLYFASRKTGKGSTSLKSLGKTLCHLSEMVENGMEKGEEYVHNVEKKINKEENLIENVVEVVSIGIQLWNKFKK